MKTYIADIIPKIQRFSRKLDDLTKLENQHWVSIAEIKENKIVYIFRGDNQLIISDNGLVEKGKWEYLGNQSLLMETKEKSYLLKHGFFDENVLALKLDSTNSYTFFVNETKYQNDLNTIEDILIFLEKKYLKENLADSLGVKNEQPVFNKFGNYTFEILSETNHYKFSWGNYTKFEIKHSTGQVDYIYKGRGSNKYFINYYFHGRLYCSSLEDAVHKRFLENGN